MRTVLKTVLEAPAGSVPAGAQQCLFCCPRKENVLAPSAGFEPTTPWSEARGSRRRGVSPPVVWCRLAWFSAPFPPPPCRDVSPTATETAVQTAVLPGASRRCPAQLAPRPAPSCPGRSDTRLGDHRGCGSNGSPVPEHDNEPHFGGRLAREPPHPVSIRTAHSAAQSGMAQTSAEGAAAASRPAGAPASVGGLALATRSRSSRPPE